MTGVSEPYRAAAFGRGTTCAVRNVSFELRPGEVTSLIDESGSGKSTIGRMILWLTRPTAGTITFGDTDVGIDVLNLLADLKERGLAVLFVTHDLSLGNCLSDRTVIPRRGAVVERGDTERVFGDPRHPYTRTLLASVPRPGTRWDDLPVPEAGSHECDEPPEEVEDGHFVAGFGTDGVHHGRKSESV